VTIPAAVPVERGYFWLPNIILDDRTIGTEETLLLAEICRHTRDTVEASIVGRYRAKVLRVYRELIRRGFSKKSAIVAVLAWLLPDGLPAPLGD
jgi:hypothetical protein